MTGKKKQPALTRDYVLSKVSQYEIFRRLLGDFKIGEGFCNILRGEKKESAIVRVFDGKLVLKDYGDSRFNGDCFDLVQFVNNCSFYEALERIDKDFNLSSLQIYKSVKLEDTVAAPPIFHVITRSPDREDLKWWKMFHQGLDDLKRENIYFPKEIWRNRQKIPITLRTFCYFYPELNAFKLYRPDGKVGKKVWYHERKWDSGIPNTVLEGKENILNCSKAFVATSKKDKMVLLKALEMDCICNIQAENIDAIDDENMEYIKANSEEQYICGDRDAAGKRFSWILTKEFGYKHVNPPDDMPKDFAAWGKDYGLKPINEHFKNKGLI